MPSAVSSGRSGAHRAAGFKQCCNSAATLLDPGDMIPRRSFSRIDDRGPRRERTVEGFWQRTGARMVGTRAPIGILTSVLVLFVGAGVAHAAVRLTSFSTTPSTTLAGGHPNVTINSSFSYSDGT